MGGTRDGRARRRDGGRQGQLRSSRADREQAIDGLRPRSFRVGSTKDEFDLRVGQVLASRTYADLAALTADVPVSSLAPSCRMSPPVSLAGRSASRRRPASAPSARPEHGFCGGGAGAVQRSAGGGRRACGGPDRGCSWPCCWPRCWWCCPGSCAARSGGPRRDRHRVRPAWRPGARPVPGNCRRRGAPRGRWPKRPEPPVRLTAGAWAVYQSSEAVRNGASSGAALRAARRLLADSPTGSGRPPCPPGPPSRPPRRRLPRR